MNALLQVVAKVTGSWQLLLVVALMFVGLAVFVYDASMPIYYRQIRLNFVHFLLFLLVSTLAIAILILALQSYATPHLLLSTSATSMVLMLLIIIWSTPQVDKFSSLDEVSVGTTKSINEKRKQSVISKAVCSMIILLLPALLLAHVHKNKDFYLKNLDEFDRLMQEPSSPEVTPQQQSGSIGQYLRAINLHFIGATQVVCSDAETECKRFKTRLSEIADNRAIFIVKTIFYFMILYLIFRYYGRVVQIHYEHKPKDPESLGLQNDVIKQCSQILSLSAAFLFALIISGVDFTSLGVFGGLIGAGLSVALRDLLGNVISGVLLLWDRTIKKDDVITVLPSSSSDTGSTYAIVQRMTMRYTIVQDRNEVRRLIPNSLLTNNIVENWTHEEKMVRLRVLIGVDYETDLRLARSLLESVCYEVPRIETKNHPPKAVVLGFGDYSINFALRFWISDPEKGIRPVLSDLYIAIYERFREEDIKIPYPRQDLQLLSPRPTQAQRDFLTEQSSALEAAT